MDLGEGPKRPGPKGPGPKRPEPKGPGSPLFDSFAF